MGEIKRSDSRKPDTRITSAHTHAHSHHHTTHTPHTHHTHHTPLTPNTHTHTPSPPDEVITHTHTDTHHHTHTHTHTTIHTLTHTHTHHHTHTLTHTHTNTHTHHTHSNESKKLKHSHNNKFKHTATHRHNFGTEKTLELCWLCVSVLGGICKLRKEKPMRSFGGRTPHKLPSLKIVSTRKEPEIFKGTHLTRFHNLNRDLVSLLRGGNKRPFLWLSAATIEPVRPDCIPLRPNKEPDLDLAEGQDNSCEVLTS